MAKKEQQTSTETRFEDYALSVLTLTESLPVSRLGDRIAGKFIDFSVRAGSLYHSAQYASSRDHFIRYLQQSLNSLRECETWMKFSEKLALADSEALERTRTELGVLIPILIKSINTAKTNAAEGSA